MFSFDVKLSKFCQLLTRVRIAYHHTVVQNAKYITNICCEYLSSLSFVFFLSPHVMCGFDYLYLHTMIFIIKHLEFYILLDGDTVTDIFGRIWPLGPHYWVVASSVSKGKIEFWFWIFWIISWLYCLSSIILLRNIEQFCLHQVLLNLANQYANNEMYPEALNSYQVIVKNKMFSNAGEQTTWIHIIPYRCVSNWWCPSHLRDMTITSIEIF